MKILPTSGQHKKRGLTLFEKLCFSFAGLSFQVHFSAIGVFSSVFLLNVAKLPPEKNVYILFISRAVDAITDPIYGYFIDRTKTTRIGKMKPWILVSTPLTAITYSLLWYIPDGFSEDQLFIWFLVWNCAYFTFSTGVRIPHTAMTMYLSDSSSDREKATILRMTFETLGLLLGLAIQGPLVANDDFCVNTTTTTQTTFEPYETTLDFETTGFEPLPVKQTSVWDKQKYFFISLILNGFFLVGYLLLIFFSKEDINLIKASEAKKEEESKNLNTLVELKRMFTFKPFILLSISAISARSMIQIMQNTLQLYFKYGYYQVNYLFNYAIIGLLICSIVFVPFWNYLMKKFEKKYLVIVGNITVIPVLIGAIFLSDDSAVQVIILFINLILAANGFTAIFLLPWAMLPNVLDEYLLTYGNKLDALFYTIYTLGIKILISVYAGIVQVVLSLVDFKTNECYQNESVTLAVKLLMGVGPLIFCLLGSIVSFFYPIDDKRAQENSEKLKHLVKGQSRLELKEQSIGDFIYDD